MEKAHKKTRNPLDGCIDMRKFTLLLSPANYPQTEELNTQTKRAPSKERIKKTK